MTSRTCMFSVVACFRRAPRLIQHQRWLLLLYGPPKLFLARERAKAPGGIVLSRSLSDSVVDANCRSFDHPNLFILGSSVFPTASTANPTSTVAALVLRAAAHIVAEGKKEAFNY